MFRVLEVNAGGKVEVYEGPERVAPPPAGALRWIDLAAQDDEQLELLRARFDFHPLAIEDCAHFDQRPKLEEYRDCLFLVTQSFAATGEPVTELDLQELHAFLGERFLVTVHLGSIASLDTVWRRACHDAELVRRGVDFLYYLVADGIVDGTFPILDRIAEELESIEDAVLADPRRQSLSRIFDLKHHLVTMRKVLSPQRDVFALLSKRGDLRVSERTTLYFRDVYDHLARINESIEANRDLLGNALEAYLSSVSNRTNEIMKYLTIMSAVFLPLAFVVGFFGQNFDNLPGLREWVHNDSLMYLMVAICVGTPAVMVAFFRRRGWL
ncbi:MAG: magnesium/cobalt transporter CorA [Deltaproteobacteria bacterium]|nr:magnesium/cobalt transporter CorA [Deltaproteobacteria bacterium]